MALMSGTSQEVVAVLQRIFAASRIYPEQTSLLRRVLETFASKHKNAKDSPSIKVQDEIRKVYDNYVRKDHSKLDAFVVSLLALEPYLRVVGDLPVWYQLTINDFVDLQVPKKSSSNYTKEFVLACVVVEPEMVGIEERQKASLLFISQLVDECLQRTRHLSNSKEESTWPGQLRSKEFLQDLVSAIGQKHPQDLFNCLEEPLINVETRYHTLQLMAYWLKHQQAHIHRIVNTRIINILLQCLMNDRSTAMISVALQCLLMLLPHIPHTVSKCLPRLFLIYSRVLCWEKFSASTSQAQKDLVTDELRRQDSNGEGDKRSSIDSDWEVVSSVPDAAPDSYTPELLSYFTYLYTLYPLNFMEYIRRPRDYLKQINFPGAESFDLDKDVIHKRTEKYQDVHILHPSLYRLTVEEELEDKRWSKVEPPAVIAECVKLYIGDSWRISSPTRTPGAIGALKAARKQPSFDSDKPASSNMSFHHEEEFGIFRMSALGLSPDKEASRASTPSSIWDPDGPLGPLIARQARPIPGNERVLDSKETEMMARKILALQSELNFERYTKQCHAVTISQMKRDRMSANAFEAETGSLLNSNRTLSKKLNEAMAFNERLQREAHSRKMHARQSEEQLNSRIRSLKASLHDQQRLEQDLARANEDIEQLRQIVVETERRELSAKGRIEVLEEQIKERAAGGAQLIE